jgi:hypothetical protein
MDLTATGRCVEEAFIDAAHPAPLDRLNRLTEERQVA